MFFSYESNIGKDPDKERVKADFQGTIQFVEEYLRHVSMDGSFANREQNKLTYEVRESHFVNRIERNAITST